MILNILSLPILFFIGIITTYEDFKCGKVRNKWIIFGACWGIGIILFFLIWHFIASPVTNFYYFNLLNYPADYEVVVFTVSLSYLLKCILNMTVALIISYLMWKFNVWAAGDAKLFIVYSILLPTTFYWKSFFLFFPSFVLMINIFIPIFIYLLIASILYYLKFLYLRKKNKSKDNLLEKKQESKADRKKKILENVKNMAIMMIAFIGLFLIIKLFQTPIQKYTSIDVFSIQVLIFAVVIIFSNSVIKFLIKPIVFKIVIILVAILVCYGLINSYDSTIETIRRTLIMMTIFIIVLSIFRKLIDFHVLKTNIKEVKIEDIKPRMSLVEDIMEKMKKDKEFYNKHIGRFYSGGLLPEQVEAVKKWLKNDKEEMEIIKIYKPFPFVPWMFVGVIITIILKGSMFHLVWNLF
ncbi:hypothetical protein KKH96_03265 [Patescibacteria group bacterium]|nr:hypothetical protein [Patescibacteria group bacterium]